MSDDDKAQDVIEDGLHRAVEAGRLLGRVQMLGLIHDEWIELGKMIPDPAEATADEGALAVIAACRAFTTRLEEMMREAGADGAK